MPIYENSIFAKSLMLNYDFAKLGTLALLEAIVPSAVSLTWVLGAG